VSESRRGVLCCVVGCLGLAAAVWGWTENRAASESVAALVVAGGAGLWWWRPGWASGGGGYRIVLVLAVPAVVLAARESIDGDMADRSEMYLQGRMNYADVMIGLYPDRDGYRFLKAQQMGLCRQQPDSSAGACRDLGPVTLERIRLELERALATGVTSNEDLLRIHAEVLDEAGAGPEVVKRARLLLRRHHPRRLGSRPAAR